MISNTADVNQKIVVVLTTLSKEADAISIAKTLVKESLAACVSVQPEMQSIYTWNGKLSQDVERQVIIKTTAACLQALWKRLQVLHPYEVPEFLVIPIIDGNPVYLDWIETQTTNSKKD